MTELRDVRLRQALDQAPDAGLQPPARIRDAIRGAAHGVVQPAWRRWWPAARKRQTPWMAAFASVLVTSLVVVIWQGQEIPGARPQPQLADQPAPAVAPGLTPAPAAQPQATPAPVPVAPAARPPAARAPAAKPAPAAAARAAADAMEARRRESTERRETSSLARQPAPVAPSAAGAVAPPSEALAKAAPSPAPLMQAPARAEAVAPAPAPAPAPAFAPPAPPPPPAPMAAPAPAPAAAPAAAARFAAPAWAQVRISAGGRSVLVPRSQADALPALLTRLLAAPREPVLPAAASLRLELGAQGVLEWSDEGWRLLPQGDPQRPQLLRVDEATAAAVRTEAERLLGR